MKKSTTFKLGFLMMICVCFSFSFKQNNNIDVSGTWILSKGTMRELLNNNISFDSIKSNYGSSDMVLNFANGHYQITEFNTLTDSSTYRVTDNYLFFESGNMDPGYFTLEKITTDSLVLFHQTSHYLNDDSTYTATTRLHFYKLVYN
jgi:hypothetical protein